MRTLAEEKNVFDLLADGVEFDDELQERLDKFLPLDSPKPVWKDR